MFRKFFVLLIAIFVVVGLASAEAGQVFSYKSKGQSAWAFCYNSSLPPESLNPERWVCGVDTYVSVFASEAVEKTGPGKPTSVSGVGVGVYQIDTCEWVTLVDVYGFVELDPNGFNVGKNLNDASVVAEVPVFDYVNWSSTTALVDVTWLESGEIYRSKGNSHYWYPGGSFQGRYDATFRPATAVVYVSVGETEISCVAEYAELMNSKSGYTEFQRR